MFQKVIVIGSPGAGKSTFSRKLRVVTGLQLYYLDMLWHKPDKTTIRISVFWALNPELEKNGKIYHGMRQNLTANLSNLS